MISLAMLSAAWRPTRSSLRQENSASPASMKLYRKTQGCQRVWSPRQNTKTIATNAAMNFCGRGDKSAAAASANRPA